MKKLPVVADAATGPGQASAWAASAMISGLRLPVIVSSPPRRFCTAAVAITVRGQRALTAMPASLQLLGHPQHAEAHSKLRDACRRRADANQRASKLSGGEFIRMCGFFDFIKMGNAGARARRRCRGCSPPCIRSNRFMRGVDGAGQADRAGVVDAGCRCRRTYRPPSERPPRSACSSRMSTMHGSALPPAFSISSAAE